MSWQHLQTMHDEGGASPYFVPRLWGTVSNYREEAEVYLCASVLFSLLSRSQQHL